jgi:hypothetical protein
MLLRGFAQRYIKRWISKRKFFFFRPTNRPVIYQGDICTRPRLSSHHECMDSPSSFNREQLLDLVESLKSQLQLAIKTKDDLTVSNTDLKEQNEILLREVKTVSILYFYALMK